MRFITRKDPVKEVLIDSDIDVSDGDYWINFIYSL